MKDIIDIDKLKNTLRLFAEQRDWLKFHSPKNLAMALTGETGELLEIFQWLTEKESLEIQNQDTIKTHVGQELADIMLYVIQIASHLNIHLGDAIEAKIDLNRQKYPAEPNS